MWPYQKENVKLYSEGTRPLQKKGRPLALHPQLMSRPANAISDRFCFENLGFTV
jgi:hypothetical protein